MKSRIILEAGEGKILTDGNIYGKKIYLSDTAGKESFYEITEEEYLEITSDEEAI